MAVVEQVFQGFPELPELQVFQGFTELQVFQGFTDLQELKKLKRNLKRSTLDKPYKNIHIYSKEERTEKIRRFKDKKLRRNFNRGTLYITRQIFAISRPRQYGRFTKL